MVSLNQPSLSNKFFRFLTLVQDGFHTFSIQVRKRIYWKEEYPLPVVLEALKDEEGQVRCHAAWILSQIVPKSHVAVPALIEALNDEEIEVRHLAAKTLWSMSPEVEIAAYILIEAWEEHESYIGHLANKTSSRKWE